MNSFWEKILVTANLILLTAMVGLQYIPATLPSVEVSVAPSKSRAEGDHEDWNINIGGQGLNGNATLQLYGDGSIIIVSDLPDIKIGVGETKDHGIYHVTNLGAGFLRVGVDDYNDGSIDWSVTLNLRKFLGYIEIELGSGGAVSVFGIVGEIKNTDGQIRRVSDIYFHIPGGDSFAVEWDIKNPSEWKLCVTANGKKECTGSDGNNLPAVCAALRQARDAANKNKLVSTGGTIDIILAAIGCNKYPGPRGVPIRGVPPQEPLPPKT